MKCRNYHKIVFIIILTLIIFIENGLARKKPPFTDPKITSGEKSTYEVIADGKVSQTVHIISREQRNGKDVYIVRTKSRQMILEASNLRPISIKKTSANGELVFAIEYNDDRVHFIYPGPKRNKVGEAPEDRYDINTILEVARGFPFRQEKIKFTLVTPEHIVSAYIKIVGNEQITVPAGTFDCYQLKAGVSGLAGKIVRTRFYFWIEKNHPHRLIKYTDSSGERLVTLVGYEILKN